MARIINLRLRELRESCGLTQQQVADKLNIDRSTYSYYETGHTTPSLLMLEKISKLFNVDFNTLMLCDDQKNVPRVSEKMFHYSTTSENTAMGDLTREEQDVILLFRLLGRDDKDTIFSELKQKNIH